MDDTLMARALCAALLLAGAHAGAQPLQDPTRPPAGLIAREDGAGAAAVTQARAPQLQSVLIARQPGGRHIAVIDGETLRLGELYKGARVARIEQDEVELVRGRSRQVLTLHPPLASGMRSAGRAGTE